MTNVQLATATVNAMADKVDDQVNVSGPGTIKIYSGTQPVNANTAITGTLLATFTLDNPAFGAASGGVITLGATPLTTTGVAAGTATHFRVLSGTPATVFDGDVTATGGGGDLQLNTTTISVGVSVQITSGTFTQPAH
ncbi:hypothetical protein [Streptomyces sp. OK228]|uniref:hypothetical protein n=1 Tax=Streptomyces sp. OK228 TaxID=1882786 RepID=UPI000BC77134|nr:hypothetical protein [Streptomyces sp. OK228]SOE25625.1 hypothetical protein SAMN05442782_2367 [Streptomyces sp. OK228]